MPQPASDAIGDKLDDRLMCRAALRTANSRIRGTREWSEGQ